LPPVFCARALLLVSPTAAARPAITSHCFNFILPLLFLLRFWFWIILRNRPICLFHHQLHPYAIAVPRRKFLVFQAIQEENRASYAHWNFAARKVCAGKTRTGLLDLWMNGF
jgi:hypothetical protein